VNFETNSYSNMYVFPGIGLGSILCKSTLISQEMVSPGSHTFNLSLIPCPQIYASAVALSTAINTTELADGRLYPDLARIREVSIIVAREVIREAQNQGLDREESIRGLDDKDLDEWIREKMYDPRKADGGNGGESTGGDTRAKL
jgi:malate dehydrogenase (oxaloacetate-decarboxylating)(NADP+)